MPLLITFTPAADLPRRTWSVGQAPLPAATIALVESVEADGMELRRILHKFTNLPSKPSGRIDGRGAQVWHGDHAKFILSNQL